MTRYKIKFHLSPFSGVSRKAEKWMSGNQDNPDPEIVVYADRFRDASDMALAMIEVIKFDGRVWDVRVRSVEEV